MNSSRRVAFFTDSFHEVNGVAHTSRQFESFARRSKLPFFSAHAGPVHRIEHDGPLSVYEVQRSGAAFNLETSSDLAFDPLIWRQRGEMLGALRMFGPDLIHITGPGDIGMIGASLAHGLGVPLAASWHTNVHEYAGRRLEKLLSFMSDKHVRNISAAAEKQTMKGAARFYQLAQVLFAPNQELVDQLQTQTGKPCFLMQRGVDATTFTPEKRDPGERPFTIGYVGRLSVEKNVRFLREIERALDQSGITNYRFLIAGSGSEQAVACLQSEESGVPRRGQRRGALAHVREHGCLCVSVTNRHIRQRDSGSPRVGSARCRHYRRWPEVSRADRRHRVRGARMMPSLSAQSSISCKIRRCMQICDGQPANMRARSRGIVCLKRSTTHTSRCCSPGLV